MSFSSRWRTAHAVSFYQKLTMLCYFLLLIPVWGPGVACYFIYSPGSHSVFSLVMGTAALSAAAAWWCSRLTAHYMVVEGMTFRQAARHTLYPILARLTFLPLVGGFFRRFIQPEKENSEAPPPEAKPDGPREWP